MPDIIMDRQWNAVLRARKTAKERHIDRLRVCNGGSRRIEMKHGKR